MNDGQIMTRQELVAFLGVSEATMYRYLKSGLIPYTKVKLCGRSKIGYKKQFFYCVELEELRKFIKRGKNYD